MNLIDSHCHLCHGRIYQRIDEVLRQSRAAGVAICVCASADLHEARTAANLSAEREEIFFTAGVHPHEAKDVPPEYIEQLEDLAASPKCVAIGEIGLDYHYNFSPPDDQKRIFAEQLKLAEKLDMPIVVHSREAMDDSLAILREIGADCSRVVFHSFTGGVSDIKRILDLGASVGFSGIVTFSRADELRQAAKIVPDDRFLIETDSPYLSPEPVRKIKTNEPANVAHIAARLAEIRNTTTENIAEITTKNAMKFFNLPAENNVFFKRKEDKT